MILPPLLLQLRRTLLPPDHLPADSCELAGTLQPGVSLTQELIVLLLPKPGHLLANSEPQVCLPKSLGVILLPQSGQLVGALELQVGLAKQLVVVLLSQPSQPSGGIAALLRPVQVILLCHPIASIQGITLLPRVSRWLLAAASARSAA